MRLPWSRGRYWSKRAAPTMTVSAAVAVSEPADEAAALLPPGQAVRISELSMAKTYVRAKRRIVESNDRLLDVKIRT